MCSELTVFKQPPPKQTGGGGAEGLEHLLGNAVVLTCTNK